MLIKRNAESHIPTELRVYPDGGIGYRDTWNKITIPVPGVTAFPTFEKGKLWVELKRCDLPDRAEIAARAMAAIGKGNEFPGDPGEAGLVYVHGYVGGSKQWGWNLAKVFFYEPYNGGHGLVVGSAYAGVRQAHLFLIWQDFEATVDRGPGGHDAHWGPHSED